MEVAFQMQNSIQSILAIIGSAAVVWLVAMPTEIAAQGRWTNNTEARWGGFDPETELITATVKAPGRGPHVRRLRKDRLATFEFDADGAGGEKTIVMIDGEEAALTDIPEEATVHIHWRPIGNSSYRMFVFKIVYFSEEKLAERRESAE